jgi:hypothetical protein
MHIDSLSNYEGESKIRLRAYGGHVVRGLVNIYNRNNKSGKESKDCFPGYD